MKDIEEKRSENKEFWREKIMQEASARAKQEPGIKAGRKFLAVNPISRTSRDSISRRNMYLDGLPIIRNTPV
jgi:hypothetical protein